MQADVLLGGQVLVEARTLEDDPDPTADGAGLGHDVVAVDRGATRRRRERRGKDRDRRRLAGAIGPEQREELAGRDLEGDAIDRVAVRLAVALDEVEDVDHGAETTSPTSIGTVGR